MKYSYASRSRILIIGDIFVISGLVPKITAIFT